MRKLIPDSKFFRFFCMMSLLAILASIVSVLLVWQMNVTLYQNGFGISRGEKWPYLHSLGNNEQQSDYDAQLAGILERYPDLQPQWKKVADEDNGFLQLFHCYEYITGANGADAGYHLTLSKELRQELSGSISEEDFASGDRFAGLIAELERIAELKERSCAGIEPYRLLFYPSDPLENFTNILLYDAKLAANRGDKEAALSRVQTAVRIGAHFSQVETQALTGLSISVLSELSILDTALVHLLPRLELSQDEYKKWRAVLSEERADFKPKQISIGEFNIVTSALSLPVCEKVWLFQLTGRDEVYDAMAECHLELINLSSGDYRSCLETWKLAKALEDKIVQTPYFSRRYIRVLNAGLPGYVKKVTRAAARFRYYDAALAELAGEELPLELITGKPFIVDTEQQTLSMPDEAVLKSLKFEPIDLAFANK